MISYKTGSNKFQFRAASIILHNNKVLLQRQSNDNLWFIPGGRVEFDLPENNQIYLNDVEFEGIEDGFMNKWVHLDSLDDYNIVPEFVAPELRCIDISKGIKHVINRSVR
jgi:hypothetical protein